jgi:alkylhydroperoxidase family enzyme
VRKHYNEREIVELTVLVGTYLMHNRVFTALRVDVEPKKS